MSRVTLASSQLIAAAVLFGAWGSAVQGQTLQLHNNVYHPLNQYTAPGVAGQWSLALGKDHCGPQAVQVLLPQGGLVTFYSGGEALQFPSPAQVNLHVGHVYRFQISGMPDHPGVELYPSVELIDKLHPPHGREQEFPVPVAITAEEIGLAVSGRMLTKVIYLEQPELAAPTMRDPLAASQLLGPRENAVAVADLYGRPIAILRLGGRLALSEDARSEFFNGGAPVEVSPTLPGAAPGEVYPNSAKSARSRSIQTVSGTRAPRRR
jgi:hypothetical protein